MAKEMHTVVSQIQFKSNTPAQREKKKKTLEHSVQQHNISHGSPDS